MPPFRAAAHEIRLANRILSRQEYEGGLRYDPTAPRQTSKRCLTEFGSVQGFSIIHNRHTGESWGYGFVEMDSDEDASICLACGIRRCASAGPFAPRKKSFCTPFIGG